MTQQAAIRVLLAEPDEIVAEVLRDCLGDHDADAGHEPFVVDRAPSEVGKLVDAAAARASQVVLAGPGFPRDGLVREIPRLLAQGTRTLVVSGVAVDAQASLLLLAGASGVLMMDDATRASVIEAVHRVASGATALHPDVVHAVLEQWRASQASAGGISTIGARTDASFTPRELEVLRGLYDGLGNRQLATRLGVAEKTIEAHKSRLYAKLGARNQAHAVRIAADRGII